jgi:hypothetical protein
LLPKIFRARSVSHLFSDTINYQLLAKTPLATFEKYEQAAKPKLHGKVLDFVRKHLGTVLLYCAQHLTSGEPCHPLFINQLARELLRLESADVLDEPKAKDALLATYIRDLCQTLGTFSGSTDIIVNY